MDEQTSDRVELCTPFTTPYETSQPCAVQTLFDYFGIVIVHDLFQSP
jgi:hypothetical protein